MKRFIIIVSVIFCGCLVAFAQSETPDWQTFTPEREEFSVDVPIPMIANASGPGSNSRQYRARIGNVWIYVFSDKADAKTGYFSQALEFALGYKQKGKTLTIGGFSASEYSFDDEDDYEHRLLSVETGKRRYIFQTVSDRGADPVVDQFFTSIRINRQIEEEPEPVPVKVRAIDRSSGNGTGSGSGSGSGDGRGGEMGSGPGAGSGSGSGSGITGQASIPTENSNVKLLSKPRAMYTDRARFYNLSGSINLRITFLADGTIGNVIPVTKLPFGLLGNAVSAARSIRFEPARKDGVPYSKTMTIVYGFTIY